MSEINKSYRIRTNVGDNVEEYLTISTDLVQDYDTFDVLSVSIKDSDTYKLHNADYGVVVGRVLANNGFGIPNAKISIFIQTDDTADREEKILYPYTSSLSKDRNGVRYNLLPDNRIDDCHQTVGTFPNKRYLLDNDDLIEIFDKYYKYTTRTNNSGDYLMCGIPVGAHTLHMDLDLSDCGILSQKPRDFVYKGYTIEQFENPNMFKGGHEFESLSQIITQDQIVHVNPFWGNSSLGETLGITRADIKVSFKFEPTCVFMGCVTSDNESQGISRKCIPTEHMGDMDELTTGEGKIEMIRKTPGGSVEEFQIKGTQLINANGVWCYQIPMNLDYLTTDEYGNMVPTDDPDKGIPTRARVRFRLSMQDNEENKDNYHRAKVLIPHNPQYKKRGGNFEIEPYDYEFGSYTKETSYRDLFWNNVYSVKSYIPRFQKKWVRGWKAEKFTGIKHCNFYGQNSPMPYNNIRIRLPLMFMILCALLKAFIFLVSLYNKTIKAIFNGLLRLVNGIGGVEKLRAKVVRLVTGMRYMVLMDGLCPDLDNWYFAPLGNSGDTIDYYKYAAVVTASAHAEIYYAGRNGDNHGTNLTGPTGPKRVGFYGNQSGDGPFDCADYIGEDCTENYTYKFGINLLEMTLDKALNDGDVNDSQSIDATNKDNEEESTCITTKTDYLIACIEMALAMEYRVINFDFYNDWINGMIYIPRWVRYVKPKSKFLGITWSKEKVRGCMDNTRIFSRTRRYVQQCAVGYKQETIDGKKIYTQVIKPDLSTSNKIKKNNRIHKKSGFRKVGIFGSNGGICHEGTTLKNQHVYYLKPCETVDGKKVNLYATDLILLGTLNDCDENGIPMAFKHLSSTSYLMPTNLALTNMETEGELYGKDGSVVCAGSSKQDSINNVNNPIATVRKTFTNEANAYSGGGFDVETGSGEQDKYVDTIPLTEAAGISWNYTGPGQGDIDKSQMYYPGGHFLGLSCVNSQSNIKSCINLQRICEVGSNMSQRREDVSGINSGSLEMVYSVPTGFISGNDIVDTDFRSMFATLNSKRLIATKRNPNTGYLYYDFMFSRPINFDGSFKYVISGSSSLYNTHITVNEEDLTSVLHGELGSANADYDPNETLNTQTRTKEKTSLYYYMFRFGYTEEDDITNNTSLQRKKFLLYDSSDKNPYKLPQYENSYYFYFGLKYGSTALDEFNKQFFSQCETMTLQKEPTVFVIPEFNVCENVGSAKIIVNNLQTPYQKVAYVHNGVETDVTDRYFNLEVFVLEGLEYGDYELTIIDDNFVTIVKTFSIGDTSILYSKNTVDFNMNLLNGSVPPLYLSEGIYRGGYIDVYDIDIDGKDISEFEYVKIRIDAIGGVIDSYEQDVDDFSKHYILYCKYALVNYELKIKYKCKPIDGEEFGEVSITLYTFELTDNSNVQLRFGNRNNDEENVTFNLINDQNGNIRTYMFNMNEEWWWTNPYFSITEDTCEKWVFRPFFFKESKSNNETFDSRVYTKNGRKILWGSPQNSYLIKRLSACTEDISTLVPGYSLDDEYTYRPTYGIINSQIIIESSATTVPGGMLSRDRDSIDYANLQYSSVAYDENKQKVSGNYFGKYNKSTNSITFLANGAHCFKNGYGCAFKPLPYGDVLFMFYDDSDGYQNMLDIISTERPDADYGILYPSFIYPVMRRPFYVSGDIFIWSQEVLKVINNGNSLNDIYHETIEDGIKSECKLHNGITVKKSGSNRRHFDNSSWFAGLTCDEFYNSAYTIDNDLYGLTYRDPTDRLIDITYYKHLSGLSHSETSIVGYYIKEGYPANCQYSEYSNDIFYSLEGGFARNFYILRSQDDNSKILNIVPTGYDVIDDTIKYYLLRYQNKTENIRFIVNGDDSSIGANRYIMIGNGPLTRFVLCRFEYIDAYSEDYEINLYESLKGQYVVIGITCFAVGIRIQFSYRDESGNEIYYNRTEGGIYVIGSIDTYIESLQSDFHLPLTGVEDKRILENPSENNVQKTWRQMIYSNSINKYGSNYFNHNIVEENSGDVIFGLGKKTVITQNGGTLNIYKIYPKVFDYVDNGNAFEWGDGQGHVFIDPQTKTINAAHNEFEIVVSASSPTTIIAEYPEWVECENSVISAELPLEYNRTFVVKHNNGTINREGNIVFRSNSNDIKVCLLTQTASSTPAGARLDIDVGVIINEHTAYVSAELVNLGSTPQFDGSQWAIFNVVNTISYYDMSQGMNETETETKTLYFGNVNGGSYGYEQSVMTVGNDNMQGLSGVLNIELIDSNLSTHISYQEIKTYYIG